GPAVPACAGRDLGAIDHGVDLEPEARLDDAIELVTLVGPQGIRRKRGEPAADREQRGHGGGRVLGVEARDGLAYRARDLGAAGYAIPRRVHAVEEIGRRRVPVEQHERLDPRALLDGRVADAEALGL